MTHRVAIDEIAVESNAIERLVAYAESHRWHRVLLIMDANTEEAVGWRVARELGDAGVRVAALRFPNRTGLAADEDGVGAAQARLRAEDPDGVVAVGSGVLTDITRYATHLEDRSFVSVPTAASMDGYASSVAAMEFGGVKATFPASEPRAIFAAATVLAAAPAEMTRSGLGDLLGKATARVDWMATHLLYGEAYCPAVDARIVEPLEYAANHAEAVLRQEPAAIERLLHGLLQSGIAMAMMGSSRPASGCEHHASHFWDLLATRGGRAHAPHGLQVGYATQFAMRLQRFAFAGGVPVLGQPEVGDADEEDARAWLGEPSSVMREAMLGKERFIAEHAGNWPDGQERWAEVRERLSGALALFPAVERALTTAGMPAEPDVLGIDGPTLRATFRHAGRLRARYTVLDFLKGQGVLSDALDAMLGEARATDEMVRNGVPE
jgi:glycerol-1-phosphate dehydrogenase [NAD(P)+]